LSSRPKRRKFTTMLWCETCRRAFTAALAAAHVPLHAPPPHYVDAALSPGMLCSGVAPLVSDVRRLSARWGNPRCMQRIARTSHLRRHFALQRSQQGGYEGQARNADGATPVYHAQQHAGNTHSLTRAYSMSTPHMAHKLPQLLPLTSYRIRTRILCRIGIVRKTGFASSQSFSLDTR